MYRGETGVGERLEALAFEGTQEYGELVAKVEAASERMAKRTQHKTFRSFLYSAIGEHIQDYGYSEKCVFN